MRQVLFLLLTMFILAGSLGAAEASIDTNKRALRFLKRHQSPDGSWNPMTYAANCTEEGPQCEPGQGGADDVIAVTAQAIYCFMDEEIDHKRPSPYKATMEKALTWLLAQEQANGSFGSTSEAQALATQALCEVYAMTADATLKEPAQRAVNRLLAQRLPGADNKPLAWGDPKTGVFNTDLTNDSWMALRSAMRACLVLGDGPDRVKIWWDSAWKAANPGWEKLTDPDVALSTFPASWSAKDGAQGDDVPAGACMAVFLGQHLGDIRLESLVNTLVDKNLPTGKTLPTDLKAFYLGCLAVYQHGGEPWRKWNPATRDSLVPQQRMENGCFDGSWDPQTQTYAGKERGRLQSTLYAKLTLGLFYIYKMDPVVKPEPVPPAAGTK